MKLPLESKKVMFEYERLAGNASELDILLNKSEGELKKMQMEDNLNKIIMLNRKGKIKVKPGYDGNYGEIIEQEEQKKLF